MGNYVPLPTYQIIFHIRGEGRNLTPKPLYGTFLMVHAKYVVENLVFCAGKHQRIISLMY